MSKTFAPVIDISHAERFCAVDKKGHVRGLFDTSDDGMAGLRAKVTELRAE